jgi:prefoldin subunit 5
MKNKKIIMKSSQIKPTTERITRSQPNKLAEMIGNRPETQRMSVMNLHNGNVSSVSQQDSITSLHSKIDDISSANKKTEAMLTSILAEMKNFRDTIDVLSQENTDLKNENKKLNNEIHRIYDDIDFWMLKIDKLEQQNLVKNVEIVGVPTTDNENLNEVVQKLFHHTKFEFTESTITDVYRKPNNNKSGLPGSIVVSFNSIANKEKFITRTKGKRLTSSFLNQHNARPVYIDEHLTKRNKYLFYWARCIKRENLVKFAWVANGKVLIKEAENSKTIIVENTNALENFKNLSNFQSI